jgi:hypothetical protein
VTSGNLRRLVTSQSTQRNFLPPVFTSTNRIGVLHFGQIGGGEFLGMGSPFHQGGSSTLSVTDNSRKRETVINHPAPFYGNSESIPNQHGIQAPRHFRFRSAQIAVSFD